MSVMADDLDVDGLDPDAPGPESPEADSVGADDLPFREEAIDCRILSAADVVCCACALLTVLALTCSLVDEDECVCEWELFELFESLYER